MDLHAARLSEEFVYNFDFHEEAPSVNDAALLSEAALAEDWNRPEEDAAWAHLQPGKSS